MWFVQQNTYQVFILRGHIWVRLGLASVLLQYKFKIKYANILSVLLIFAFICSNFPTYSCSA